MGSQKYDFDICHTYGYDVNDIRAFKKHRKDCEKQSAMMCVKIQKSSEISLEHKTIDPLENIPNQEFVMTDIKTKVFEDIGTDEQSVVDPTENVKKRRIINKKCVLKMCNYVGPNGFFGFPKNEKLKKKWLEVCGLNEVKNRDQLCYQHFHKQNVIGQTEKSHHPRLRLGTLPTLNLPKLQIEIIMPKNYMISPGLD